MENGPARTAVLLAGVMIVASIGSACRAGGTTDKTAPHGAAESTGERPSAPNDAEVNPPGDIPDNQMFVGYGPTGGGYTVSVPEGWARRTDGTATVFSDKYNRVRIETTHHTRAPTVRSVAATELPQLRARTPGYRPGAVTAVRRRSGQVIRLTYQASSPVDPVTGKSIPESVERYLFWHRGMEAVVTLAGPVGADNVDPWRAITDSLHWT